MGIANDRIRRVAALGAAFVLAAGAAAAEPAQTRAVDIAEAPWSAVGRINNSAYGRCSAILVAPGTALTAAHCLYNQRSGRFLRPASIHLLFGFEKGAYGFHTTAAAIRIPADYRPGEGQASAPHDWAVVTLAEPAPGAFAILPLATAANRSADDLVAAGFGQERSEILSASPPCGVEGETTTGLLVAGCRISHGFSGGPLIRPETGELVGMTIATSTIDGRAVTVAIPAARLREALAGP